MNFLINQADDLLKNHGFEYAFCGGWAIDLFVGAITRKHSDIDILAYWSQRDMIIQYMQSLDFVVYEMLGNRKAHQITNIHHQIKSKRNIFCCKVDCELVKLSNSDEDEIFFIDFNLLGQTKLNFIEFLFNEKTDAELLYARNHSIRQPLCDAILYNNELPYLSPEMCLLYKSTDIEREGYQSDYAVSLSKMSKRQRQWLDNALKVMYPSGHKWRI